MVWFIILSTVLWKKYSKKILQGLTSCTQGRIILYYPHGIALEGSIEKNCFKMKWYSFCSYTEPNQGRIIAQMVNRLSVWPQVSFIKTDTYKGIGQRLIGFCFYVSVVVRRFATGDVFVCLHWITSSIFTGRVWFMSWPKYRSHYYFF